ncbi:MAG TPA: PIN domain-containing protein [Fimbriiglobus sp.]|nr:PIN domain-containing protein [Fimbriiglobus sp.]
MGPLSLPSSGPVYVDSQVLIYAIESNPTYYPLAEPVLAAAEAGEIVLVTSELTVLEVLVRPMKTGDNSLVDRYEGVFHQPNVRLVPVSLDVLRAAASLRASIPKLRTPDAIHAATALHVSAGLFVTNDFVFRSVPGLSAAILDDHRSAP